MKAQVVRGKGEGAKYVEVYSAKIEKAFGMKPFPGTLNLKVKEIPPLELTMIPAFGKFGAVGIVACSVNGERAFAVFPKKGKRPEGVVEIIAEKNIKALMGLENGDYVDIQF